MDANVGTGSMETSTIFPPVLGIDWNYSVYLPAGYRDGSLRHPVIYLLHGLYGNHGNFSDRLDISCLLDGLEAAVGQSAIAVCVDGFNSFYIDVSDGMHMEQAIVADLVPAIDARYRTQPCPSHRALCGISMGGFGAARFALRYPEIFGQAALVSPAVWRTRPLDDTIYRTQHAFRDGKSNWSDAVYRSVFPTAYMGPDSAETPFFIVSTQDDEVVSIDDVEAFVGSLRQNGIDVTYQRDTGDSHCWDYWQRALPRALVWSLERLGDENA